MKFTCPRCGRNSDIEEDIGDFPVRCHRCATLLRRKHARSLAGWRSSDAGEDALFAAILREAGFQSVLETPRGVEACLRVGADGHEVFIVINHSNASQTVSLPWQARNHLNGQIVTTLPLEPYGAAVLTRA